MVCWYCQPKTQHATSRAGFGELLNLYKNNWRQLSSMQNPFYSLPERAVPLPVFSTSSSPSACSSSLCSAFSHVCVNILHPQFLWQREDASLCPSCFPETWHHLLLSKADSLKLSPSQTWCVLDQSSCLGLWISIADQSAESAGFLVLRCPKQQVVPQSWSKTQMCGWNLSSSWGEHSCGEMLTDHKVCETGGQKLPPSQTCSHRALQPTWGWIRWGWVFSPLLSLDLGACYSQEEPHMMLVCNNLPSQYYRPVRSEGDDLQPSS